MHHVVILTLQDVMPFDLGIACDILGNARGLDDAPLYMTSLCGEAEEVRAGPYHLRVDWGLNRLALADTIVIPGMFNLDAPLSTAVLGALRDAAARGARIASICSGAFVLAATGLLDGARITTHWKLAAKLIERHPAVVVDPDVLYIDHGQFISSAGASAGIDMCLHIVSRDHGHAVAAHCARLAVAPLHRDGGQAQFVRTLPSPTNASLAPLLAWIEENLNRPLTMEILAAHARMSVRTFFRRFREQTGTTPLQWIIIARLRSAQALLETTSLSIDWISLCVGFETPEVMRHHFFRNIGIAPRDYRARFGNGSQDDRGYIVPEAGDSKLRMRVG